MKPFRIRPVPDGFCSECRDRRATKGGMCVRCWVAWAHGEADECLAEGDIEWANWLRWEAYIAEGLAVRIGEPRVDH